MPYIEDLQRFEFRHEVELAYSQELPHTINAIAVGWLNRTVPRSGSVKSHVIDAIKHFSEYHYVGDGLLGYHTCEICNEFDACGELLINIGDKSYVLPQMILHYMIVHKYTPPYEFIHNLEVFWSSSEASVCRKNACGAEYHQPFHEEHNERSVAAEEPERTKEAIMKRIADLSDQGLDEDQIRAKILEEFVNGQPLQDNEFREDE